ncbi:MAG: hypothetical protein HGA47_08115 [Zoogloea sp.]|nr:hypothetical protein [Zoogloea sp.]
MMVGPLLAIIEEAGTAVLTLTEGVDEGELLASRLTRGEVLRQLQNIAETAANLPPHVRTRLPEIDWEGWTGTMRSLRLGGVLEDEAICFAVRSLVPATLMWMRVYRQEHPALFSFSV